MYLEWIYKATTYCVDTELSRGSALPNIGFVSSFQRFLPVGPYLKASSRKLKK